MAWFLGAVGSGNLAIWHGNKIALTIQVQNDGEIQVALFRWPSTESKILGTDDNKQCSWCRLQMFEGMLIFLRSEEMDKR